MLRRIGVPAKLGSTEADLRTAEKLILPGVGSFDSAVKRLQQADLTRILSQRVTVDEVPVLGICLGMQLLTRGSEEGLLPGFGWIAADTIRFPATGLKVPHMGWNHVAPARAHPLIDNLPSDARYYFVHAFHVKADDDAYVLMKTDYGSPFHSVIWNGRNVFGAQFHPEKSHRFGMQFLENFARL